jgi:hypothetical protein
MTMGAVISAHFALIRIVKMDNAEWIPKAFIDEEIEVRFDEPPLFSKKPDAPDGIRWRGKDCRVHKLISSWVDYDRKGRMSKNMKPHNLRHASKHGSWGVGKFYFRVQVEEGRVFDIYYDRSPETVDERQGTWILWRELEPG